MINCYKILELPNFAHQKDVQRAYRILAKKYHPDINGSANAQELFVVVSKAYQTLSEPQSKKFHDTQLRDALMWESEGAYRKKIRKMHDQRVTAERRKKWAYQAAQKELKDFDKKNSRFSYTNRVILGIVGVMLALTVIFKNYFIDLNSNELPLMVAGFSLFVISAVLILAGVYRKMRISVLLKRNTRPYETWSFGMFFFILVMGPLLVFGLSSYRKSYHLSHYEAVTTASIVEITYDDLVLFSFEPPGERKVIMKRKSLGEQHIYNEEEGWILVRYSKADPRIVELIERVNQ